jgi:hypothetical protein
MTENVSIVKYIVYGAIAGVVGGAVDIILKYLVTSINLGTFDDIDYASQQFLGTTAGNANLMGVFIIGIVMWAFLGGLVYGVILFLLMTRAGWQRDLTRYVIAAAVMGVVLTLVTMTMALSTAEWDLIDIPIQFIIGVGSVILLAPIVYYLEDQFGSAS